MQKIGSANGVEGLLLLLLKTVVRKKLEALILSEVCLQDADGPKMECGHTLV